MNSAHRMRTLFLEHFARDVQKYIKLQSSAKRTGVVQILFSLPNCETAFVVLGQQQQITCCDVALIFYCNRATWIW